MHIDIVRAALHKQPFLPFVIRLADGRAFSVPPPDYVAVSPRQIVVIDSPSEAMSVVEPLLIMSLESASAGAQPTADGEGSGG
jgi:hypothetical protein